MVRTFSRLEIGDTAGWETCATPEAQPGFSICGLHSRFFRRMAAFQSYRAGPNAPSGNICLNLILEVWTCTLMLKVVLWHRHLQINGSSSLAPRAGLARRPRRLLEPRARK